MHAFYVIPHTVLFLVKTFGWVECLTEFEGTKDPTNYLSIYLFFWTLVTRSLDPICYTGETDNFSYFFKGIVKFLFLLADPVVLF